MNDGILSQAEIDALLSADNATGNSNTVVNHSVDLNDFEKDTIGEIGNIGMGTSATTLSTLLRKKVAITTPSVSITTRAELQSEYPIPYVVVEVKYTEGINGTNVFIVRQDDASIIANLMMGGEGKSTTTLDELSLSAVSEAMNQMMGSATTSLSSMFNKKIDIAPPEVRVVDFSKQNLELTSDYEEMVQIKFKMEIEDLVNSEIMQIMPIEAVKSMIGILMGDTAEDFSLNQNVTQESESIAAPVREEIVAAQTVFDIQTNETGRQEHMDRWENYNHDKGNVKKGEQFAVQPVQFAPLQESIDQHLPQNIGLIMDVPLDVSVELGKTSKTIKEVLELSQGSIIQLDKMAGEPVDLLVNGKLIAKGEVVVIDENYGIRVTTILSPIDRMSKFQ
ncbi:MAG: flagellar motor switch phosphatase FliY [Bacillota bacterium]|nr:flagellar motor switch phosphatase FliY [Bacillota bacterium]